MINLLHGDCLELMKTIESGSVDLILTDPPYGTIKNAPTSWDKNKTGWDEVLDYDLMWSEINRILRKNGKCILFSQEPFTSNLIKSTIPNMPFSMRAIWLKDNFANALGVNKNLVNFYEDICLFSKKLEEDKKNNPLYKVFINDLKELNLDKKDVIKSIGSSASHYYTNGKQFRIPTLEKFNIMTSKGLTNLNYDYICKIYNEFNVDKRNRLKEKYPSIFNLPKGAKYKSNVFEYKKDYEGLHPTQKPVALLEDLIKTYSNENNLVLDFTFGSCSTGIACLNTNRKFIGIEMDDNYFSIGVERIKKHEKVLDNTHIITIIK